MSAPVSVSGAENFWQWSLKHYARNKVETILLQLQDDFGFNVNIALWCCWCAEQYEATPEIVLRNAIDQTDKWNADVTGPLRSVRRCLKEHTITKTANDEPLRKHIKQAELAAEKEEQSRLEALAETALSPLAADPDPRPKQRRERARQNLAAYTALIGAAKRNRFTVSLLEALIDHIYAPAQQKPVNRE